MGVTSNCGIAFFLQAILYGGGQIKFFFHQWENVIHGGLL